MYLKFMEKSYKIITDQVGRLEVLGELLIREK
jgi:hypothetical protein